MQLFKKGMGGSLAPKCCGHVYRVENVLIQLALNAVRKKAVKVITLCYCRLVLKRVRNSSCGRYLLSVYGLVERNHSFLARRSVYISFLIVANVPAVCCLHLKLVWVIVICCYVMECYVRARLYGKNIWCDESKISSSHRHLGYIHCVLKLRCKIFSYPFGMQAVSSLIALIVWQVYFRKW